MFKVCLLCNKVFLKSVNKSKKNWGKTKYCSRHCSDKSKKGIPLKNVDYKNRIPWNKTNIFKGCVVCGKEFKIPEYRRQTAKYCSKRCQSIGQKEFIPWNKGKHTGLIPNSGFKKGQIAIHPFPKGHIPWNKGIIWNEMRGKNHPLWKGGKPKKQRKLGHLTYKEYRKYCDWRNEVFKRDNWTCQSCKNHGGILHAHHIKQWKFFPRLRYDIINGMTLCPNCHQRTEDYGRKVLNTGSIVATTD